ncbi:Septum site-determining protein MinD [Actinomadura rubteroloni]|uniref:Septum site-determining protein MinD n=1 Tax=Actinomadura rubteroloni TaxID=1926885 RepID=A0A2P4UPU8_9ACTN|nr:P-loop NTPase [Actinomadura rubteroloni]POM27044.1 Septum site-determining protein MinD [Actinomadura rubteroloni]
MPIICEPNDQTARRLAAPFREDGHVALDLKALRAALDELPQELVVVLGPGVDLRSAVRLTALLREEQPALGVVLVRDRLDVDVLAEAMRAGVREVVPDRDFPALLDACKRVWEISSRLRSAESGAFRQVAAEPPAGQVVVVFAGKGGCGKSMVSTNLGVALARQGRRVCLVDLDLGFGDVGIMLRVDPQRTVVDAVPMVGHMDRTGAHSILTPHESGLQSVLAPIAPGDAEKVSGRLVTELLAVLRQMFEVVVVDSPPQFSEQVLAAFDVADTHVLVASPEVTALKGLRVTLDMLDTLGYARDARAVVLNRADARAGLSRSDIDRVVGMAVAAEIPNHPDVPVSINRGVPLTMSDPRHPVSRAIDGLIARTVAAGQAAAEPEPPRRMRRRSRARS